LIEYFFGYGSKLGLKNKCFMQTGFELLQFEYALNYKLFDFFIIFHLESSGTVIRGGTMIGGGSVIGIVGGEEETLEWRSKLCWQLHKVNLVF